MVERKGEEEEEAHPQSICPAAPAAAAAAVGVGVEAQIGTWAEEDGAALAAPSSTTVETMASHPPQTHHYQKQSLHVSTVQSRQAADRQCEAAH